MAEEIFAIKFGKNISIGNEINGQKKIIIDKEKNSNFSYLIKIDECTEIDVYDIIKNLKEKNYGKIGKSIKISNIDEIFRIEVFKSGKVYLLETILIKLFEKIKKIVRNIINKHLNKTIIIFNNFQSELILIIHRSALLSGIQIMNFIDLNKSIRFFLDYKKIDIDNSVTLIKFDEKIELSIFQNNKKRIFNSFINKDKINYENFPLKDDLNEIKNESKEMIYYKKMINNLTLEAYGMEENLDKIYIFNNTESENSNKISILGALHSNSFPKSKECKLIFNFLDFEENYLLNELVIMKNKYKINKKILEITIDDYDIPFENCYYRNIKVTFKDKKENSKDNLLTIYYNQKNYFCCTKDVELSTSTELIFFKNFPNITINDKYNVEIKEKFEEKQIFKRINILNVNREKIKLNSNPLIFYDIFDFSKSQIIKIHEEDLFPDVLFLIGQNLNVLSYFNKDTFYKTSIIQEENKKYLIKLLKNMEIIENDDSLENLVKNKELLNDMISYCSNSYNMLKFKNYLKGNIQKFNQNDVDILIKYGKYQIFKKIFYNNNDLDLSDSNYKIYKNIFDSLDLFYEECKAIENDTSQLAKIYNSSCHMIIDYLLKYEKSTENLKFDLIQFDKDSIYKDANNNNIDLILNLTKKSFLYPYFLQFNSSFKESQNVIYEEYFIETYKTSMITLNQIKLDLIKSLPKYGIRIGFDTDYIANTILNTDITIYNEKKLFGHFLTRNELDSHNDKNYIKRVKISFLQKHERFSHYKKCLNKSEKDFINSPRGIVNYEEDKVLIMASKEDYKKGELGESLEYIMTNGERELIDNILNLKEEINLKEIYEINSFLESTNNNLISKLKNIQNLAGNTGNSIEIQIKDTNKEKNEMNDIQKKKTIFENINMKDIEYEKRKIEMIKSNPIKKYTFERNTIQEYTIINGKLVPFNSSINKK